jgi:hypothetical protein
MAHSNYFKIIQSKKAFNVLSERAMKNNFECDYFIFRAKVFQKTLKDLEII